MNQDLIPADIVAGLDKFVIGQDKAKRAIAIAMRDRWLRQRLDPAISKEISPKNMIIFGPTGCGKTEVSRRIADMTGAPFVKVEATNYSPVGHFGRDATSMLNDLMEQAMRVERDHRQDEIKAHARTLATRRVIDAIVEADATADDRKLCQARLEAGELDDHVIVVETEVDSRKDSDKRKDTGDRAKRDWRNKDGDGEGIPGSFDSVGDLMDNFPEDMKRSIEDAFMDQLGMDISSMDLMGNVSFEIDTSDTPPEIAARIGRHNAPQPDILLRSDEMRVRDALPKFVHDEEERYFESIKEQIVRKATASIEANGVVFIDEIDKITDNHGLQRDLLAIVEGTVAKTRYGPLKTDYILFIGAGAFHNSKVQDFLPEFQGRFPIRVEMKGLTRPEYISILTEKTPSLCDQYIAMLDAEGVTVSFTTDGVERLADLCEIANRKVENIGARRLFTLMEKLFEDLKFEAAGMAGSKVTIDAAYVDGKIGDVEESIEKNRYIM